MRILIKGGVWKNTEDEILKAAVMKYGLNQWARISSLLTRKSAKQCKARWYEWLDPSIKKTEWTREEDEKLLHLAKLMPQQWRTIAPIVGRTSQQCLERYDKLLDAAAARDDSYDAADDPRRLRPGEIDPNPEAKPARPDPIDMDEDEKEMLSEARARLANTKGKKAKRKAREKSLEEARRMASLQKKRELKAAGIELRQKSSKKKTINYNKEIAFEKRPAMGFYDTGEEGDRTKEMREQFRPQTLEELEGRRRQDIEKGLMKADVDRAKLKDRHDRPQAVAQSLQQNETGMVRRRGKMMLPAPQVTEEELRHIQSGKGMDVDDVPDAENEAARLLRGDYETPQRFATPMRTPRTATVSGQDRIMQQARDASRLQQGQTPLLGGENAVQIERGDFGNSVAPPTVGHATPHPLLGATPGATPRAIAGVSSTPSVAGTPLRTPGRVGAGGPGATPRVRDELGLNELDSMADGDARAEKARRKLQQSELRAGLSGLPQPQNEYQVMVPELPADQDAADADAMEEDAADADARRKAVQKAREEAELRKRSQVLQRNLPRPAMPTHPERGPTGREQLPKEAAELMIHAELVSLQEHDNTKYPLKASKKNNSSGVGHQPSSFEDFEENVIGAAHELVAAEAAAVRGVMHHDDSSQQEYDDAWQTSVKDFIYLPAKHAYARGASATNTDRIEAARGELDWIRGEMSKEAKRAGKLEDKAGKLTKGLVSIAEGLYKEQDELMKEVQELEQQVFCFKHLEVQEQRAAPKRLAAIDELVQRQKQREKDLQKRYKELQDLMDMAKQWCMTHAPEARRITVLAMPVAATFLLNKLLGVISVILVGHLGPSQLAASALGDSLANVTGMSILASFGGAMQTLCGQAYGAKAYIVLGQVWQRAVLIMGLLCLPIAALWLFIGRLLLLMGQTPAVADMTAAYMRLLIPGLFGQAALVTTGNYLSSQGIVVPSAAVSAGALVLHLPLALVCIHTFGLAYRGAALAVSLSYCLQFAALLAYILWSRVHVPTWGGWSRQCLREWWPFMRLALPSMLLVTEWWASEIVVMTGGLLPGDAQRQLSAMSIYQAVNSLCFMLPLGFGVAVTTRVSNELGAGNDDAAKQAAWTGTTLTVLSSTACALPLALFRRQIVALFSPDRQLDSLGAQALLVLAPYVIGDGLEAVLSGVVKGAGRQASAVPIVLFSYYCVGVPLSLLLGFQAGLKVTGLCTGMLAGTIVHAGLYAALVARLDWRGEAHRARNRVGSSKAAPQTESELYPTSTSYSETALGEQDSQETEQLLRSTQLQA